MICVFKRSPEFASSNPRGLSGHGEVAPALAGTQASAHFLFVDVSFDIKYLRTCSCLRVLREICRTVLFTSADRL